VVEWVILEVALKVGEFSKKYAKNLAQLWGSVIRIKRLGGRLRQCLCHLSSSCHGIFSPYLPDFSTLYRFSPNAQEIYTRSHTRGEHYYYNIFKFLKLNENTTPSLIITAHFSYPPSSLKWKWEKPSVIQTVTARWRLPLSRKSYSSFNQKKRENYKKIRKTEFSSNWGATFLALAQLKMRKLFLRLILRKIWYYMWELT